MSSSLHRVYFEMMAFCFVEGDLYILKHNIVLALQLNQLAWRRLKVGDTLPVVILNHCRLLHFDMNTLHVFILTHCTPVS